MAIYTHNSIDESAVEIKPEAGFDEACLIEVKLRGGDKLLLGSFYRSPMPTITSDVNNENLNKLLTLISSKDYSQSSMLGRRLQRHQLGIMDNLS